MNKAKSQVSVVVAQRQETTIKAIKERLKAGQRVFSDRERGLHVLNTKGNVTRILNELGEDPTPEKFVDAVDRRLSAEMRKETMSFHSFV
jgi:transposase-like protein